MFGAQQSVAEPTTSDEPRRTLRTWGFNLPTVGDAIESNVPLCYPEFKEIILPSYVAIVVKSLRNLNPHDQTIDLSCTLVVRINFGAVPETLREELTKCLAFRLNESPLRFDDEQADSKWKGSLFVMTVRLQLWGVVFVGESFDYNVWKNFPFDEPRLTFRLEFTSHTIEDTTLIGGLLKGWKVRYNVHQFLGLPSERGRLTALEKVERMMSFKSNADSLPSFDIDTSQTTVSFQPERKTQGGVTMIYYAVVTFHIPLFRHPGGPLRSMVFPLVVTDVGIFMCLFMQPVKYEERIGTLVTVLLALFAFLNFARATLPDVPISTWLDLQIFKSVAMCLLAMLESLLCKYEYVGKSLADHHLDGDYNDAAQWSLDANDWSALSPFTIASRIVRMALFAVLVGLMLHTFGQMYRSWSTYQKRLTANAKLIRSELKKRSTDFEPAKWGSPEEEEMQSDEAKKEDLNQNV